MEVTQKENQQRLPEVGPERGEGQDCVKRKENEKRGFERRNGKHPEGRVHYIRTQEELLCLDQCVRAPRNMSQGQPVEGSQMSTMAQIWSWG